MTAWSVAEFIVRVELGQATGVECVHCGTAVKWSQPEHSNDPADVTVRYPAHDCPDRPTDIADGAGFATDAPPPVNVDVDPDEVLHRKPIDVTPIDVGPVDTKE